jgi:hypothetical protein
LSTDLVIDRWQPGQAQARIDALDDAGQSVEISSLLRVEIRDRLVRAISTTDES